MKRLIMIFIGILLFAAGYNYTRRQAEYVAHQTLSTKSIQAKLPVILPFKTLPSLVFRADKSLSGLHYN
ncbi:hypothetical protein [Spirosoma sp. KNUC1025]|uniref:hypothetical protein n=1 Tax=Spirosoma sp. KNUC1025 TaxID=2894082 RepID=UPI003866BCA8|nr:hypothetical protein LN737_03445 [Spirosoma sp. KNUC1025]